MDIKIQKIKEYETDKFKISTPKYHSEHAAGFDLCSANEIEIAPGETRLVSTGLKFEIPVGYELQVRPRSGVTSSTKLRVHLGTVDSDYRGEVYIIVENVDRGHQSILVQKGARIAQGVINKVEQARFTFGNLTETVRGTNGFGSTGD